MVNTSSQYSSWYQGTLKNIGDSALVRDLAACLIFLVPVLFLTKDSIFSLSDTIIGGNFVFGHLWGWNIMTAGIVEQGRIISSTIALDYPVGGSLTLIGWSFIIGLAVFREIGIGLILGTNLLLYLHLLFACYCAYRLAWHLTSNWAASVFGGISFGLSPFALSMIWNGQFAKLAHGFLPLVLLLTISLGKKKTLWPVPALGIALGFSVAAGPYIGIFCSLLALIGGVGLLVIKKTRRLKTFLRLTAAAAIALIAAAPFLYYFTQSQIPGLTPLQVPSETAQLPYPRFHFVGENQNATLSGWFTPDFGKPIGSSHAKWTARHVHYLGWVNLLLGATALVFWRRRKKQNGDPIGQQSLPVEGQRVFGIGFFLITGCIFFVLAHGYYLILTPNQHTIFGMKLTLPLFWLSRIFEDIIKVSMPYRGAMGVTLCLAMLASMGLDRFAGRIKKGSFGLIVLIAGILLFVESVLFSPVPYPLLQTKMDIPRVYRDLGKIKNCKGVLEIPFETILEAEKPTGMNLYYMLYQQYHGHPLANYDKFLRGHTVAKIGFMQGLQAAIYGSLGETVNQSDDLLVPHFSYLVVHENLLNPDRVLDVLRFLDSNMELVRKYPQDGISLYYHHYPQHHLLSKDIQSLSADSTTDCLLIEPRQKRTQKSTKLMIERTIDPPLSDSKE